MNATRTIRERTQMPADFPLNRRRDGRPPARSLSLCPTQSRYGLPVVVMVASWLAGWLLLTTRTSARHVREARCETFKLSLGRFVQVYICIHSYILGSEIHVNKKTVPIGSSSPQSYNILRLFTYNFMTVKDLMQLLHWKRFHRN